LILKFYLDWVAQRSDAQELDRHSGQQAERKKPLVNGIARAQPDDAPDLPNAKKRKRQSIHSKKDFAAYPTKRPRSVQRKNGRRRVCARVRVFALLGFGLF
jgi:hypothetical protein